MVNAASDVERAPAGVAVAPDGALRAAGRGARVVGAPLEQPGDLLGLQRRVLPEEERGGGRDLRRGERRPDRVAELVGPQSEYGRSAHPGRRLDELPRNRREDRVARRGDVVVDRVAVRVVGHRAVLAHGADADHVRQRRRVVRELPRRRRRLRPVSDRCDHDDALRVRVLDSRLLERRVRVELRVRADRARRRG